MLSRPTHAASFTRTQLPRGWCAPIAGPGRSMASRTEGQIPTTSSLCRRAHRSCCAGPFGPKFRRRAFCIARLPSMGLAKCDWCWSLIRFLIRKMPCKPPRRVAAPRCSAGLQRRIAAPDCSHVSQSAVGPSRAQIWYGAVTIAANAVSGSLFFGH